jgi:acetyl-CoA C-acetyltransferase
MSETVVVVDGARTPIGAYGKAFKAKPAFELGAIAIAAALERSGVESGEVQEVVLGCVGQVGSDAFNARRASLAAGLPVSTNAYNVNRLCGSGLQAVWSGATEIMTGQASVVVAGGNENMTMQPFLDYNARDGYALAHRTIVDGTLSLVTDPWGRYPMGVTAENVAVRFGVSRAEQDEFALGSQQRASKAIESGLFAAEIVAVPVRDGKLERQVSVDEHVRPGTTLESLGKLRPAFREGGSVTAGNSSGINDGAAAVVLMSERDAAARAAQPLGRIVAFAKAAMEPELMGYAPTNAVRAVLQRAGLRLDDIGAIELNEAFAAQAVAVIRDLGIDPERANPNGGAIALGHPVGATGAILLIKLLHHLRREGLQYGLATLCIGGGQAVAMIVESMGSATVAA